MFMHQRLVCVLLISVFVTGCATTNAVESTGDDVETQDCGIHKLKFKVDANGCVERVVKDTNCDCDAEAVIVRACETVEWKVTGKKKSISFVEADGSPFNWFEKSDSQKISGEVQAGTARDKPYKYTVRTEGLNCDHDPMIIVQP